MVGHLTRTILAKRKAPITRLVKILAIVIRSSLPALFSLSDISDTPSKMKRVIALTGMPSFWANILFA
ncbi:hypothetical protein ACFLTP_07860 [Chloroflexota bacterium]